VELYPQSKNPDDYLRRTHTPIAAAISARFSQTFENARALAPINADLPTRIRITANIKANTE
jgi:hypothetical protein